MNDFKLLAVRPLSGCDGRFLKNLTPDLIYHFFNTHTFLNSDGGKVKADQAVARIDQSSRVPEKLYNIRSADRQPLEINISAIAGKNGTGKSSLVELLFAAIYLFSLDRELLKPDPAKPEMAQGLKTELKDAEDNLAKLMQEKHEAFLLLKGDHGLSRPDFDQLQKVFYDFKNERYLRKRVKELEERIFGLRELFTEHQHLKYRLKVEVYFELDGQYYQLKIDPEFPDDRVSQLSLIDDKLSPDDRIISNDVSKVELVKRLFYTVAVNYSHHALNAETMGDWVNTLFHKNDGYSAPLVINPMRTDGNFDINTEMALAKYRLLCNVLIQKFNKPDKEISVTDSQYIQEIVFTLDRDKIKKQGTQVKSSIGELKSNPRAARMISDLMALLDDRLEPSKMLYDVFPLKDPLINYIIRKIDRISELYPGFEHGYRFGPDEPMLDSLEFLKSLISDGTHITNKLIQAMNLLHYYLVTPEPELFDVAPEEYEYPDEEISFSYTPEKLLKWMKVDNGAEILKKLPPSIFKIDFVLYNPKTKTESAFSDLSSGEQQLIYTIQSVIYHLNNLQSAHASPNEQRIKYEAVNIIYDEIELYFHPDFQRRLIKELLAAISDLHIKQRSRIRSINLLFLTHSPFILSDIPEEHILLLDISRTTGKTITKRASKTFAANINDLLADNFFLTKTLVGKFADKKVNDLVSKIKDKKPLTDDDRRIAEIIGDDYLRLSVQEFIKAQYDQDRS